MRQKQYSILIWSIILAQKIVTLYCCMTADGSSGYKAESERYHLYVSLACPYASRTLILRKLKGLDDAITVDVVDLRRTDKGWAFSEQVLRLLNTMKSLY